jgi:hypothetical protein
MWVGFIEHRIGTSDWFLGIVRLHRGEGFYSIFSTSVLKHSLLTLVLTLYSPNYACVLPAVWSKLIFHTI